MKKTIFLSLVAGAIIFSGCGGGGSSDNGSDGSGGSGGAGGSGGSGGSTLSITVNPDNTWTVVNDTRSLKDADTFKTYAEAEAFRAGKNLQLPSAIDLLAFSDADIPRVGGQRLSSAWAKDQFVVYFSDKTIGKGNDAVHSAVICMEGNSIDVKHPVTENADGSVTDATTNLTWSAFQVYDKGNEDNLNQFTFPITNPGTTTTGLQYLTAAEYCQNLGAGWELPTLGELRTVMYLDGTTAVKVLDNLNVTYVWSATEDSNASQNRNYVVKLNENSTNGLEDRDQSFYVTCVKR
jgi:hypothetical protein